MFRCWLTLFRGRQSKIIVTKKSEFLRRVIIIIQDIARRKQILHKGKYSSKTNLDRVQKYKATIAKRTAEEKQRIREKFISTINSRSVEEKSRLSKVLSEISRSAAQNRSPECEQLRRERISQYWKNMSPEELQKILDKRSEVTKCRTPEQKSNIRKKFRISLSILNSFKCGNQCKKFSV